MWWNSGCILCQLLQYMLFRQSFEFIQILILAQFFCFLVSFLTKKKMFFPKQVGLFLPSESGKRAYHLQLFSSLWFIVQQPCTSQLVLIGICFVFTSFSSPKYLTVIKSWRRWITQLFPVNDRVSLSLTHANHMSYCRWFQAEGI